LGEDVVAVRLSRLIALVRTVMRLPIWQRRELVQTPHGGDVHIGEIVEVLHRLHTHAQPVLDNLKEHIRASPPFTPMKRDGETMVSTAPFGV
jgi:hypothetical protein